MIETNPVYHISKLIPGLLKGLCPSVPKIRSPIRPGLVLKARFKGNKERIIIEPVGVFFAKGVIAFGFIFARKMVIGLIKNRLFVSDDGDKVHAITRKMRQGFQFRLGEPPIPDKKIRAYKQRIAGKDGPAMVGRVSVMGICWI